MNGPRPVVESRAGLTSSPLPLNFFQQAMSLWDRIYPYNAVHALRVEGPARADDLRRAADAVCDAAGLGRLHLDARRKTYRYDDVVETKVDERPAAHEPLIALSAIADELMNAAFPPTPHHPLRWAIFDETGAAAHWIVLAYHHIVADAPAIEALLARVVRRYFDDDSAGMLPPLRVTWPRSDDPFAGALRRSGIIATLRRGWRLHIACRDAHKMPDERGMGDRTHTTIRALPDGLAARLSAAAKRRGAGVNDAFLAALAAALAAITPDRLTSRRRRKIALGTVLNGRRLARSDWSSNFGVCLADGLLLLDNPDAPPVELLASIAAQTAVLKDDPIPFAALSALRVFFIRRVWPLLFVKHTRRNYRRIFPLCGGVSTYFANTALLGAAAGRIRDYVRVCPPGPAMPIVLAPTGFRDGLKLVLTCRASCLPPPRASALLEEIERRLNELCQ